jgi:SOS-response transcriptional repressor LexA
MTADFGDISHVLSRLLTLHNISEAELSRKINVPRATINRLASGRTPDPRVSTLETIAEYFSVSLEQLLGKQPLYSNADSMVAKARASLPIIDWKDTAHWHGAINGINPENHFDWIMIDTSIETGLFALRVRGDSMWPNFQENTILIIDPDKVPKNRSFVIYYIKDLGEVVFRQLLIDGSYKFLKAINSMFPNIQISEDDQLIGTVLQTRNSYD